VSGCGFQDEIVAKGLTAPRVTPQQIEEKIASEHYFTAADGLFGQLDVTKHPDPGSPLFLLTFCVLVMRNGFTVVGKSACASPENFDAELGKKIARQDAFNQIWPLEGYLLREKLSEAAP
jgi:Phage protein (N4 Gp49/phage Sf6 gene 66) family